MKAIIAMCAMFLGLSFAHANQDGKTDAEKAQDAQTQSIGQDQNTNVIKEKKSTSEVTEQEAVEQTQEENN